MPIIILEGIDGSGKSTLANHLAELSPWQTTLIHRGPIKTSVNLELVDPLFEVEPDELLIADRWHLSEVIYGPLYRKTSQIDAVTLNHIEGILNKLDVIKVVVQPPLSVVSSRLETRGEDFLKPADHLLVYSAYAGLAQMFGYQVTATSDKEMATYLLGQLR